MSHEDNNKSLKKENEELSKENKWDKDFPKKKDEEDFLFSVDDEENQFGLLEASMVHDIIEAKVSEYARELKEMQTKFDFATAFEQAKENVKPFVYVRLPPVEARIVGALAIKYGVKKSTVVRKMIIRYIGLLLKSKEKLISSGEKNP